MDLSSDRFHLSQEIFPCSINDLYLTTVSLLVYLLLFTVIIFFKRFGRLPPFFTTTNCFLFLFYIINSSFLLSSMSIRHVLLSYSHTETTRVAFTLQIPFSILYSLITTYSPKQCEQPSSPTDLEILSAESCG